MKLSDYIKEILSNFDNTVNVTFEVGVSNSNTNGLVVDDKSLNRIKFTVVSKK